MNQQLKRIEATLHDLTVQLPNGIPPRSATQPVSPAIPPKLKPLSQKADGTKVPTLPKLKTPSFSSHQHAPNPNLAVGLLQEIQKIAGGWHSELQDILHQIQDLYLEGPIVDGWLESTPESPSEGSNGVRRSQGDRLMNYELAIGEQPGSKINVETPRAGYRLCGLDADGKFWFRPCPPEQVPILSVAIARYHKLRQLLGRKQHLETRLSQLAETLVILHSHLQEDGTGNREPNREI